MTTAVLEPIDLQVRKQKMPSRANSNGVAAERLVLTGFMGSGKSTVGRLLAGRLGWAFLDLDDLVEQRTGRTVAELFAERGEAAFRKEETLALAAALRRPHVVLALGGGAPETLGNRLLLEQTPATTVVYLSAPFGTLAERCARQVEAVRPLLADISKAEQRFAARQPMYQRLAHHVVETHRELAKETVETVLSITGIGV